MLIDNYSDVLKNIKAACIRSGRKPDEVTLIPVSKTKPVSDLMELYNSGIKIFGENYVQELVEKTDSMPQDIQWHMIGHLQRNKVKYVVPRVRMIHSVDSLRLAEEIDKECKKLGRVMDILVEVNCEEESKFGFSFDEVADFVLEVSRMTNLHVCGLMTSAPYVTNPEDNRKFFRKIKQLAVDITDKNIDNVSMDVLSMGMTNDYVVAVEEGATCVRVGTAIFGARDYSNKNTEA
ncbi:MAG: YggS family pyridoxal phosphate-dependent enzyme [Lachnospiraceae bacterium]